MKKVLVWGHSYFVNMLVPLLNSEDLQVIPVLEWRRDARSLIALLKADVLYFLGGSIRTSNIYPLVRLFKIPVIKHWVGTDVLEASVDIMENKVSTYAIKNFTHWAIAPWLVDELNELGIRAQYVPLSSTGFPLKISALPDQFTILAYIPENRSSFYGCEYIIQLADEFPDIQFFVIGSDANSKWLSGGDKPQNLNLLGHVKNIQDVLVKSTLLVRITEHDGLSFMVMEALAHGRYAIWNRPFKYTIYAHEFSQLRKRVEELFSEHKRGTLDINIQGANWVSSTFALDKIVSDLQSRFISICQKTDEKSL